MQYVTLDRILNQKNTIFLVATKDIIETINDIWMKSVG